MSLEVILNFTCFSGVASVVPFAEALDLLFREREMGGDRDLDE
jgi:hypothetical protein